jgi:hypothetical protein
MKFEDIQMFRFKDYELDIEKARIEFSCLKKVIKIFDKSNFKNYVIGGSLMMGLKWKKMYRTPKDTDICIENINDFKFAANLLLKNGFWMQDENGISNPMTEDNSQKYNKLIDKRIQREWFAEPFKNRHYKDSVYAPYFNIPDDSKKYLPDFRNMEKLNYYLLHDPKRINYIEDLGDSIKIKFKYKNDMGAAIPCCYTSGYIYYSNTDEIPNGVNGFPLNDSTKIIKCNLLGPDESGGFILSSKKIRKNMITKKFKYKISLYKDQMLLDVTDKDTKCKVGLIYCAKDTKFSFDGNSNYVEYESLKFKLCDVEMLIGHKYLRQKDFDDYEFYDLEKTIFDLMPEGSLKEKERYMESLKKINDENNTYFTKEKSLKIIALIKDPKSKWIKNLAVIDSNC